MRGWWLGYTTLWCTLLGGFVLGVQATSDLTLTAARAFMLASGSLVIAGVLLAGATVWGRVRHRRRVHAARSAGPPPAALVGTVSEPGGDATQLAVAWMRHLGAVDAAGSDPGTGADIRSRRYVARVSSIADVATVAPIDVQELARLALREQRCPVHFTTGRYRRDHLDVADRTGIALFTLDLPSGALSAANRVAHGVRTEGMGAI